MMSDCGVENKLACILNHFKFNLAEMLIWGGFYVNSYGEILLGPDHSARCTEHVSCGFTQTKDDFKQAEKMLSHHKPVMLGSPPQHLRKPETSNFLNQYVLMLLPDSLSIMSRNIILPICMTFSKYCVVGSHYVWVWPCSLWWDYLTDFIYLKSKSSQTLLFLMPFKIFF